MVRRFADRGWRRHRELVSLRSSCQTVQRSSSTPVRRNACQQNPEQDEIKKRTFLENTFWSMSGDFKCRHNEVRRAKLCILEETGYPIPLSNAIVMGQTRTSIDNASEQAVNEYWIAESDRCHALKGVVWEHKKTKS